MAVKKFLKAAQDIKAQAEEPKEKPAHDESNWLVSYADMMTLLCGFFIMLFSMSKMDEPQYEHVKEAMSQQFGGDYKSPTQELAKFVTEVVQEAGIDQQAIVKTDGSGVTVAFQSTLFFETLSADVKPEGRQILDKLAKELFERQQAEGKLYQIVVEGHTDSRPVVAGSFPSNWELSGARASRVVRFFLDDHFLPDHLTAIGYGDTRPVVNARQSDGSLDDELLAKNRRVVLRILSGSAESIPFPKFETPAQSAAILKTQSTAPGAPVPATAVAGAPNAGGKTNGAPVSARSPASAPAVAPQRLPCKVRPSPRQRASSPPPSN